MMKQSNIKEELILIIKIAKKSINKKHYLIEDRKMVDHHIKTI